MKKLIVLAALIMFGCENSPFDIGNKLAPVVRRCSRINGEWKWNIVIDEINNIYKVEGNCSNPKALTQRQKDQ